MYLPHFALRNYPFEKTLRSDELLDIETQAEARTRIRHLIELRGIGLPESQSRATLCRVLRTEMSRLVDETGKLPVLIFDEAHHLGNDVLAEFKMLTNYRMDSSNRLCLLLVGLTELRNRLRMAVHEPLAQRITVNCHIPGLRHQEVGAYVEHRMALAGADVPVFEPAAIEAVALASNRIPRQIDRLAHHALIAAAADGMRTVTDSHVNRAADEVVL